MPLFEGHWHRRFRRILRRIGAIQKIEHGPLSFTAQWVEDFADLSGCVLHFLLSIEQSAKGVGQLFCFGWHSVIYCC